MSATMQLLRGMHLYAGFSIYAVCTCIFIFKPPDVVVGGQFYRDFIFFYLVSSSFLFVSYRPSSLNGTQPKPVPCLGVNAV